MARTPTRPLDVTSSTRKRLLIDDCFRFDPRDGARLSHDEVIAHLRQHVQPVVSSTVLDLDAAQGRVAAQQVAAARPVPGHTNSAVDGYAVAHAELDTKTATEIVLAGRAAAGHAWDGHARQGEAIRIFTGAVMPAGCDSVAMQEDCETFESDGKTYIRIPPGLKQGANVRSAGEDVEQGQLIVRTAIRSARRI